MGIYWLRAEETAGADIAKSESRGVYDWPSLSMSGLKQDELAALWVILRGTLGDREPATGDLLARDDVHGTSVTRVSPQFVRHLAELRDSDIGRAAEAWANSGRFAGYSREGGEVVLRELASFAGSAWYEGSSVPQAADDL
jgi:hypothetical protein